MGPIYEYTHYNMGMLLSKTHISLASEAEAGGKDLCATSEYPIGLGLKAWNGPQPINM